MLKVLNKINEPKDLKQLSNKELEELALNIAQNQSFVQIEVGTNI